MSVDEHGAAVEIYAGPRHCCPRAGSGEGDDGSSLLQPPVGCLAVAGAGVPAATVHPVLADVAVSGAAGKGVHTTILGGGTAVVVT